MRKEEVKDKIIDFFVRVSRHKSIDPYQDIRTMEFANSLMFMQLIIFIEKEFNLNVDDDVIGSEQFRTVNGISDYVFSKL